MWFSGQYRIRWWRYNRDITWLVNASVTEEKWISITISANSTDNLKSRFHFSSFEFQDDVITGKFRDWSMQLRLKRNILLQSQPIQNITRYYFNIQFLFLHFVSITVLLRNFHSTAIGSVSVAGVGTNFTKPLWFLIFWFFDFDFSQTKQNRYGSPAKLGR